MVRLKGRWWIWFISLFFVLYEYSLRVFPEAMIPNLMKSFNVYAVGMGLLSAFYWILYVPLQLVYGHFIDRFGLFKLLLIGSFLCSLGCLIFAFVSSFPFAAIGRTLMGIGSAGGFIGIVYVCAYFFPKKYCALLIGISASISDLGFIIADNIFPLLVKPFGWRDVVYSLAIVGLTITFFTLLYIVLKKEPEKEKIEKTPQDFFFQKIHAVLKNPRAWLIGISAFFAAMLIPGFINLWGIPFLTSSGQISKKFAGLIISIFWVGKLIGSPITGRLSDLTKKRKGILLPCLGLGFIFLLPVIYLDNLPIWLLCTLFFFIGLCLSANLLFYPLIIELNPDNIKGISVGLINGFSCMGSILIQPLIGLLLDKNWNGKVLDNIPVYSRQNYQIALSTFPFLILIAIIILIFLKEKFNKQESSLKKNTY